METTKINNLEIRIFSDADGLSLAAADIFLSEGEKAIKAKNSFSVALSGGRTSQKLYELLGGKFKDRIDWSKVHIFWGDERAEKDVPEGNFQTAYQKWLKFIIAENPSFVENIHRVKMEIGFREGAEDYEKEIERWAPNGFDLALNGAGADGHRNGVMPDNNSAGWKNQIWEQPKNLKVWGYEMPPAVNPYTKRITLTPWFLNQSGVNVLLLAGEDKKDILKRIVFESENYRKEDCPAITFNEVPTIILTDKPAASGLSKE